MTTQPGKQGDLHGSAPDTHPVALLLIDVINHFEFPRGEELFDQARQIAPRIAELRKRARQAGVPVVYVNDNFGKWRSNFEALLKYCLAEDVRGRSLSNNLFPPSATTSC